VNAFCDATCPRCGKRFGWTGGTQDRPPCPRCQHTVDPKELAEVEAELDRVRREVLGDDWEEEEEDLT